MRPKDYSRGGFVEPVTLNREQIRALVHALPKRPTVTDSQLAAMISAIESTAAAHLAVANNPLSSDTFERLSDIKAQLKKVNRLLDGMSGADERMLDQYYGAATKDYALLFREIAPNLHGGSQFAVLASNMEKAIDEALEAYRPKQAGRKANHTYTFAIDLLAGRFQGIFPELKISSKETSVFYKLVGFLLIEVFNDIETSPSTPINHYLESLKQRG